MKGFYMSQERYPKEVILKDRREVILRTVEDKDKKKLLDFYQNLHLKHRSFLKEDPCEPDIIKKWINNQKLEKALSVLAFYKKNIVGNAVLLLRPYGGRKHVGRLRIILSPDFSGKQLGTWMVFDLTKRAMEMGLEKIRADFVVGIEDPTIRAFRNMDFVEVGLLKDYIQDEDGNYYDYQIMIKQLHKEWSDF